MSPYTYNDLAARLKALGFRLVKSQPGSTTVHLWADKTTGAAVTIPDRGDKYLSISLIDKICDKLGISQTEIAAAVV